MDRRSGVGDGKVEVEGRGGRKVEGGGEVDVGRAEDGGERRYYRILPAGEEALEQWNREWEEFKANMDSVIGRGRQEIRRPLARRLTGVTGQGALEVKETPGARKRCGSKDPRRGAARWPTSTG